MRRETVRARDFCARAARDAHPSRRTSRSHALATLFNVSPRKASATFTPASAPDMDLSPSPQARLGGSTGLSCVRENSFFARPVEQRLRKRSRGAAKFVSPPRQRWEKWNTTVERQRRGTVLTHTLKAGASTVQAEPHISSRTAHRRRLALSSLRHE